MLLGRWSISITLSFTNQFIIHTCFTMIKYGVIFQGTSSNSGKIFTLQRKPSEYMPGAQPRTSCRSLFKQLETVPVPCQYILSLINFIINNLKIFRQFHLHSINTSNKHDFHRPNTHRSCFHNSKVYAGIKIFSSLPCSSPIFKNEQMKFKVSIRKYIHTPFIL